MTKLLIDTKSSGFKAGEIQVTFASRQTGKSFMFNNLCQEILMDGPVTFDIQEKRWHGCRYAVVRPDTLYKLSNWQAMESWCVESFGPAGDSWKPSSARWYANGGAFWFRRPADLSLFMLKWANVSA